jgi:hypothetical protein
MLVTANVVSSSQIIFTLMMEAIRSSEMSILATRHDIPEDGILQSPQIYMMQVIYWASLRSIRLVVRNTHQFYSPVLYIVNIGAFLCQSEGGKQIGNVLYRIVVGRGCLDAQEIS